MMESKLLELYFHIPFCMQKCLYCDFLSAPAGESDREAYMKALFLETEKRADRFSAYRVSSIFIGGGTPSMVKAEEIAMLLDIVKEHYVLTPDAEITIEVNPGTVDAEKLSIYRKAGINRLSIGLQSAQNEELRALGRIHSYEQFLETYELARAAGFTNMNVDLMSALPGQSMATYRDTIEKVLALRPEHISAYSLIVEEGTPFHGLYEKGQLSLPDEDTERDMYEVTKQLLEKRGYYRYEISNYALPGRECQHNLGYWQRREYLGLGLGSASLIQNHRFHNTTDRQKYLECFAIGQEAWEDGAAEQYPVEEQQQLSVQEQMEETMYLGFRMTRGVSLQAFYQSFGCSVEDVFGAVIEQNCRDGLLEYRREGVAGTEGTLEPAQGDDEMEGVYLALTDRGLDLSNYVMAQFLLD